MAQSQRKNDLSRGSQKVTHTRGYVVSTRRLKTVWKRPSRLQMFLFSASRSPLDIFVSSQRVSSLSRSLCVTLFHKYKFPIYGCTVRQLVTRTSSTQLNGGNYAIIEIRELLASQISGSIRWVISSSLNWEHYAKSLSCSRMGDALCCCVTSLSTSYRSLARIRCVSSLTLYWTLNLWSPSRIVSFFCVSSTVDFLFWSADEDGEKNEIEQRNNSLSLSSDAGAEETSCCEAWIIYTARATTTQWRQLTKTYESFSVFRNRDRPVNVRFKILWLSVMSSSVLF